MQNTQKYAVIGYSSINIGDEIQSIAASRFLPSIDYRCIRERLSKFYAPNKVKLIMNAWYMWEPKYFPPSDSIEPLLISMHFRKEIHNDILKKKTREYLIKYGPVGCRDMQTYNFLKQNGIDAYFSGCMTLTLEANPEIKKQDYILAIGVSRKVIEKLRKSTNRPVYNFNTLIRPYMTREQRDFLANAYLTIYQSAHCIVTSRLHVAMPSLALNTPVLLFQNKTDSGRYEGLIEHTNNCTQEDFLNGSYYYDTENPPTNPNTHLKLKELLIDKCSQFSGFNNPNTLLYVKEPLGVLLSLMSYGGEKHTKNTIYYLDKKTLIKETFKRLFLNKEKYDL